MKTTYKYSITYQIITPESAEDGDYFEQGYEVEDAEADTLRELIGIIEERGLYDISQSPVNLDDIESFRHLYYSSVDGEVDYGSGETTFYSLHISDPYVNRRVYKYLVATNPYFLRLAVC